MHCASEDIAIGDVESGGFRQVLCLGTHHRGCACHEARRDEEIACLRADNERLRAELADAQADLVPLRRCVGDALGRLVESHWGVEAILDSYEHGLVDLSGTPTPLGQRCIDTAREGNYDNP